MTDYTVAQVLVEPDEKLLADLFYDWFCTPRSLPRRAKKLQGRLREIASSPKIARNAGVFFKNNCPMSGTLYDDFRIYDLATPGHDIIYTIVPASGHDGITGRAELWGRENKFASPILTGKWTDIVDWFFRPSA